MGAGVGVLVPKGTKGRLGALVVGSGVGNGVGGTWATAGREGAAVDGGDVGGEMGAAVCGGLVGGNIFFVAVGVAKLSGCLLGARKLNMLLGTNV